MGTGHAVAACRGSVRSVRVALTGVWAKTCSAPVTCVKTANWTCHSCRNRSLLLLFHHTHMSHRSSSSSRHAVRCAMIDQLLC